MKHIANPSVFVTYNSNSHDEQTLAIRLHSIGAVNGFQMFLPDRFNSENVLDEETKRRLRASSYVVYFALSGKMSKAVKNELEYAFEQLRDNSRILVIYDSRKKFAFNDHVTAIPYDPTADTVDKILTAVLHKQQEVWQQHLRQQQHEIARLEEEKNTQNALVAFLGIGLGLALLSSMFKK